MPLGGVSGELGLAIGGGADYGEFPFVTAAHGGGATVGDIILEIGGTPVLGMTLGDVRGVLNSCPHPIRIKTVSPGMPLTPGEPHAARHLVFTPLSLCVWQGRRSVRTSGYTSASVSLRVQWTASCSS